MKKITILFLSTVFLIACSSKSEKLSKAQLLEIVRELDKQFVTTSSTGDIEGLANLYTDSAKYVPNSEPFLLGRNKIKDFWKVGFDEGLRNIRLTPLTADGNKEIIYETGIGTTDLMDLNADTVKFVYKYKYVNIWRLQNDGSYKLDVDSYTGYKDGTLY